MKEIKGYICGCVRNCESFLRDVFHNIEKVTTLLDDYHIYIAFDQSDDLSLDVLREMQTHFSGKMSVLVNENVVGPMRVKNISNARNRLLQAINNDARNFDYFIMMDMDDVCASPIHTDVLQHFFEEERTNPPTESRKWDVLTFYRRPYYDIWAVSADPFYFSCWNFPNGHDVVRKMRKFLYDKIDKMDPNELYPVHSAFNGFAIYRRDAVKNCHYEWHIDNAVKLLGNELIAKTCRAVNQSTIRCKMDQDCEHRFFHLSAIQKNGAKIVISPRSIF
tara:strand:- start:655 stop:1485 length:831 start_codon:yes stop_codon:yes gene_type:complete